MQDRAIARRGMRRLLEKKMGDDYRPERITIIPNRAEFDRVAPQPRPDIHFLFIGSRLKRLWLEGKVDQSARKVFGRKSRPKLPCRHARIEFQ